MVMKKSYYRVFIHNLQNFIINLPYFFRAGGHIYPPLPFYSYCFKVFGTHYCPHTSSTHQEVLMMNYRGKTNFIFTCLSNAGNFDSFILKLFLN
ncbi:hypothetical protein ES703_109761 [subsurface metagenome]